MNIRLAGWVALGGALGAVLRFALGSVIRNAPFPTATLLINVIGSFAIGIIFGLGQKENLLPEYAKLFLATGICGGFTTFSAFSLENVLLLRQGNFAAASVYTLISVCGGIAATYLGLRLAS